MARYCMLTGLLHANNKSVKQHAHPRNLISAFDIHSLDITIANLPSAAGNVSGNRCESDCRSRGREFDPGPVSYFQRD